MDPKGTAPDWRRIVERIIEEQEGMHLPTRRDEEGDPSENRHEASPEAHPPPPGRKDTPVD